MTKRNHMTESEAREKWCPFSRATRKSEGVWLVANRADTLNPKACRCITSDCMAWRWHDNLYGYCGLSGNNKT